MLELGTYLVGSRDYHCVGLIVFSEDIVGLTIEGVEHEVANSTLTPNTTRRVNNEITEDCAQVIFQRGELLVTSSRDIV